MEDEDEDEEEEEDEGLLEQRASACPSAVCAEQD